MKLCKDCKFHRKQWISYVFFFDNSGNIDKCVRPNMKMNPINGKSEETFCFVERQNRYTTDVCGPKAKYFEPK